MEAYTALLQIYNNKRMLARQTADANLFRALKIPEFRENESKRQILACELARKKAYGLNCDEEIKAHAQILRERLSICIKHGIDESSFLPKFSCSNCEDTGFVGGKPCGCFLKNLYKLTLTECGISPPPLPSFTAFDISLFSEADKARRQKLKNSLEAYCMRYPDTSSVNFLFSGKSGTGKTFLSGCMASALVSRGFSVVFVQANDLNQVFLKAINDKSQARYSYSGILQDADFLIVDDLGSEALIPNITRENIHALFSFRIERMRPMIFTTNFTPSELSERYGEKIFARIIGDERTLSINFDGDNLRLSKKRKNA